MRSRSRREHPGTGVRYPAPRAMAYLLFIDESGHDLGESPYEVLAGVAVEDRDLWNLIQAIQDAERDHFGRRISRGHDELKAKRLLKRKTYRLADQLPPIEPPERTDLARSCLDKGDASRGTTTSSGATKQELTALAQAKIAFVERVIELCALHHVRAFASMVDRDAPRPRGDFLRKDYSYLFERYYYFLDDRAGQQGLVVFDEIERSRSHLLLDQMHRYFLDTAVGKMRAARVVPEAFFVHSDLTTLVQVADLVAYVAAWGVRFGKVDRERRQELGPIAARIKALRYRAVREREGRDFTVWSFSYIPDLRPREEQEADGDEATK